MKKNQTLLAVKLTLLALLFSFFGHSQSFKDKLKSKIPKKKVNMEMYECGYVHKETLGEKANPMKLLQKAVGGAVTNGSVTGGEADMGKMAMSIFYQANLHPQGIIKYPTKVPGWQTCGDAVFAGITNKSGLGLTNLDGEFKVENDIIPSAGLGTYFHGFDPSERGAKTLTVTSSSGTKATVSVAPAKALAIKSVDGKVKGEEVIIDGTKDIVIELMNGDADPKSNLHVQLVCKLAGTPIIYDVIVTKAKNTIYIPKEAFKNFEGSPSPFMELNTLIVNRVSEAVIEDTPIGALRTISAYMDWMPITVGGDLSKGSIMTAGFDESKNTNIDIDLTTSGIYNFKVDKGQPFTAPPVKLMNKIAIASFVVKGSLMDTKTTTTTTDYSVTTTKLGKWFPELPKDVWQKLADQMHDEFSTAMKSSFALEILPLDQIINTKAYEHIKPIQDDASKKFVEVGAGGTKRILTSSSVDLWKDLSITFGADFVSQRLVKELNVDAVLAVNIDLNFDFETETLNPRISIVAFAPDVSYKTSARYFSMNANTPGKSLDDSREYTGGVDNVIYQMIEGEKFNQEFINAMKELSSREDEYPVYEKLWKAKL